VARDADVVVIGSGPNGLVAACMMAMKGHRVLVFEANPRRPGGALGSEPLTMPGFTHDVGAAFFPFGKASPAFRELELERHGIVWQHADYESCHVALDGSTACISRNPDEVPQHFGSEGDESRWRDLARWHAGIEPDFLSLLLGPIGRMKPLFQLGPWNLMRLARVFAASGHSVSKRLFRSAAAQRVLPALALHTDVGPDDRFGAAVGYVLGIMATTGGYPVPRGGAQRITDALVTILESHGGRIELGRRVTKVVVHKGRAEGVELDDGQSVNAYGILADTSAASLLLGLVGEEHLSGRVARRMREFPQGWGTFKMDWAMSGPVPWADELATRSAVVHTGEDIADLNRFTAEVRSGALPERPYLVIGQQSLMDRSRAPRGRDTLWAYSRVPPNPIGGWEKHAEVFADRIETRIEELAPGFRARILARNIVAPSDLEAGNANLVGGDIGGGSNAWNRQLIWRPVFPHFRYRMPIARLYLCSSYAHPGAGVHGMCGYNAASLAARDLG
jgi:phytoene dehydrogenase-like protein